MIPTIHCDNKAAVKVAMSEDSTTFKHVVKLCYHYIRFEVCKRNVVLRWISGKVQIGDIFTKALGREKFEFFRKFLVKER